MANTLGTVSSSLIIQTALSLVYTKRPALRRFGMSFTNPDGSNEAKLDQAVISRIKSIPAVGTFADAAVGHVTTDVSVTIDAHKQILHTFTADELAATDRNYVQEAAEPLAVAIGNHIVDYLAALITAANFPNKTTVPAGWGYTNTLVPVRQKLVERGVPDFNRYFFGNCDVYSALLTDPLVIAALNNPSNGDAIRTGRLPDVAGMALDEYPALPTGGNQVGFAGVPDALVYAGRVERDPKSVLPSANFPGNFGRVTDPLSGFTVTVCEWIGTDLTANVRVSWYEGRAVGNANNGERLVTG